MKDMARLGFNICIVHTGQHHDAQMSRIFFQQLHIPKPDYNLEVHGGLHGEQTGLMLVRLEKVIIQEQPDFILVFGDTNSTLAGALTAAKLGIPLAHIEAGMRSYNRSMPEEVNRVITDHLADIHFCATKTAVKNLAREGITHNVHYTGDVMVDLLLTNIRKFKRKVLRNLNLRSKKYTLLTLHRAYNTDDPRQLEKLIDLLQAIPERIVFPIHPRTKQRLITNKLAKRLHELRHVTVINPVGYLDMLTLIRHARVVMTDSGGVQKEAYVLKVPCLTLRQETEWLETTRAGWNSVTGLDQRRILKALNRRRFGAHKPHLFGQGRAGQQIATKLRAHHRRLKKSNC